MKRFFRNYALEIVVALVGLAIALGPYAVVAIGSALGPRTVLGRQLKIGKGDLTSLAVGSAGFLFVAGQVYSRLKERRDARRKRAQDIFIEWHSKEIRESRIFVCRWRDTHPGESPPALGGVEKSCADEYSKRYQQTLLISRGADNESVAVAKHPIDDPEQQELHFFRIYQYFERWALLVDNSDVDQRSASEYSRSYKKWYIEQFIKPWMEAEKDVYIRASLALILSKVGPDR